MVLGFPLAHANQVAGCLVQGKEKGLQNCDVSFISLPTFAPAMTTFGVQRGTYVIRNNTRAGIALTGTSLVRAAGDTLPASATFVDTTFPNSCGSFIAPGAVCNISVVVFPTVLGTLNRYLNIGVNTRQCHLASPIFSIAVSTIAEPVIPGFTSTGLFYTCLINAKPSTVNEGATIVNGGVCSTASIVGFPPGVALARHENNAVAEADMANSEAAYASLQALCPGGTPITNINGTFGPGTYCVAGSQTLTSITLSGAGPYYFVIDGGLTTTAGARVNLVNGAVASSVFFATSGVTRIEDNTLFQGNLLSGQSSMSIGEGVIFFGTIRSLGGNLSIDQLTISAP